MEQESYYALLQLADMLLYFVTESPPTPDKLEMSMANTNQSSVTGVNLVFRVSDCRAAYEALTANGVHFLSVPHSPEWGGLRCFAVDPNGYLIEIEEA